MTALLNLVAGHGRSAATGMTGARLCAVMPTAWSVAILVVLPYSHAILTALLSHLPFMVWCWAAPLTSEGLPDMAGKRCLWETIRQAVFVTTGRSRVATRGLTRLVCRRRGNRGTTSLAVFSAS